MRTIKVLTETDLLKMQTQIEWAMAVGQRDVASDVINQMYADDVYHACTNKRGQGWVLYINDNQIGVKNGTRS